MAASGSGQTCLRAQYHSAISQTWLKSPRGWTGSQAMQSDGVGSEPRRTRAFPVSPGLGYFLGTTVQLSKPGFGLACWAGEGRRLAVAGAGAGAGPTEQSFFRVWMQPERSFWTQQPEVRSMSRSLRTSCSICWSFRMQGENLAPRWMRSIWSGGREGL